MTRRDLIVKFSEKTPFFLSDDAGHAVSVILSAIANALVEGKRVEVRSFGSFSVHLRKSHVSRNPRTGEKLVVPDKRTIRFKPGKELRDLVKIDDAAAGTAAPEALTLSTTEAVSPS